MEHTTQTRAIFSIEDILKNLLRPWCEVQIECDLLI